MSYQKIISGMALNRQQTEVFSAFVKLAACACACGTREAEYLEEIKRWSKEELASFALAFGQLVEEMEAKPFTDLLGGLYCELQSGGKSRGGEFHTPAPICRMMGAMTADGLPPTGIIRVAEPACGAGAMILGFAASIPKKDIIRLRVDATDINLDACNMCFVNTSLWNIPTTVTHGNALSGEVWARWKNAATLMWTWPCPPNDKSERTLASRQGASPSPASRSAGSRFAPLHGWTLASSITNAQLKEWPL